jgi:hypothetical protein
MRSTLDMLLYGFIDGAKRMQPSITLKEAAHAFTIRYNIDDNLYSVEDIVTTYHRINKDYLNAQRRKEQRQQ